MNSSADLYLKCEIYFFPSENLLIFLSSFLFKFFAIFCINLTLINIFCSFISISHCVDVPKITYSEVFKGLNKTRGLFLRYRELQKDETNENPGDLDYTTTELRNSLRSIEWDLEDLEDTIVIAEKNPKHKIDSQELNQRRQFINATKNEIKSMKDKISILKNRDKDITAIQPLLDEPSPKNNSNINSNNSTNNISIGNNLMSTMAAARHSGTKYSKLENIHDSPSHHNNGNYDGDSAFLGETVSIQQRMLQTQDEQLDMMSDSIGTLKTVSRQIGIEVDEQAVMLDDFGNELDVTETKLDATMRKMGKVLQLSNNDRRQWTAIFILSVLLLVVIILFIIL
ncbi:CLUMA_CG016169, isoform A [Clunio marinus]|uniref:CLUMA_CG016169, isoform A n=1 Tax=Clunio marinus TaxID=568069 RepID=A0A1J1IX65_9DIPT|nr:CLUMA_CG016169, isoform A [Clunio marinus]